MLGNGTWKPWGVNLAEATWLVNPRGSANHPGPAQTKRQHTMEGDKILHMGKWPGKSVWISPHTRQGKLICGIVFAQGLGCTLWVM